MAKVNFVRRLTKDEINNVNIEDGNFIINTDRVTVEDGTIEIK